MDIIRETPGHVWIFTTQNYTHVVNEDVKRAMQHQQAYQNEPLIGFGSNERFSLCQVQRSRMGQLNLELAHSLL